MAFFGFRGYKKESLVDNKRTDRNEYKGFMTIKPETDISESECDEYWNKMMCDYLSEENKVTKD